jgi:RNA polymerase sigma factor (sigma-70 family)
MTSPRLAVPELDRVFQGETISGLSEWQLLERYLERRDETAFEALVTRHGPMVLGVCRRALGFSPEAEDAFQATFLVLVRRARDLGPRDAIGPWLYGVATRVAARARTQATRRRRYEAMPLELPAVDRGGSTVDPDLVEVLDLELSRLPCKYRSPLVLCYLEGRTHEEAAQDLQWPVGTVKGRLARARELLRSRLSRRGFSPSSGVLAVISSPDLKLILDRALVERTVEASAKLAAGQSVAQVVSESITSQIEGALAAMFVNKMKWALLVAVATGVAFTSAAVLGRQAIPTGAHPRVNGVIESQPGDPAVQKPIVGEPGEPQPAYAKSVTTGGRSALMLSSTEAVQDNDPRTLKIYEQLNEPISMSFANETPLDDVLKYIKQATTSPKYNGIPIYVDPIGLQNAERSMNSTVQIDLEGVPLRRTLQLILTQLGMAYFVQDGILVITSEDDAKDPLPPPIANPAPIGMMIAKSERGELSSSELKELIEVIRLRRQVKLMHENYEAPPPGGGGHGRGGFGAGGGGDLRRFPGEENLSETRELLKEVRELIQLVKTEKETKKQTDAKKPTEVRKAE